MHLRSTKRTFLHKVSLFLVLSSSETRFEVKGQTHRRDLGLQDVHRTFPGHPWLDSEEGKKLLRRVLVAYSWRNPGVGYCQVSTVLQSASILSTALM